MQPVTVHSRAPEGMNVPAVSIEVFLGPGLPALHIVGLVETAVKESRDRVRAAIQNSGFDMPDRRIVVSLAPADLPKSGGRYDLAIAIGILCASGQVPAQRLQNCEFLGELALNGRLRRVPGALPVAMGARRAGRQIVVPADCEAEAGLLQDEAVLVAGDLLNVAAFMQGNAALKHARHVPAKDPAAYPDMADVEGQLNARRALEIAAAGGHHMLMTGPPGTGKSMLAQRLPGIMPAPRVQAALETAALYSLRGEPLPAWRRRPFRAPHHSATAAAMAGGNASPRPGEISLAHNGVLFLDELPEFQRGVLETLREPLETGSVTIARARQTLTFPARFQLIAAMNPCPCGYAGDGNRECRCTPEQIRRYQHKISGPFLDRIDIRLQLQREKLLLNSQHAAAETSRTVARRVAAARARAQQRAGKANAYLGQTELRDSCWPHSDGIKLLEQAATRFDLSRRACDRTLRVARTIADLGGAAQVQRTHVAEALALRQDTSGD